ncbi:MFS transporter [Chloroflexota bacterium]
MIKKNKKPRIFHGWWIVLTGGFLSLWMGGYKVYGISALFKPISSELGFSRIEMSVPSAIGVLEGGFEGPIAGWVTDKYGPRWIMLLGVFMFGLSLVLMNYIESLWAFYIVWGVILATGMNIAQTVPVDTTIANWFVKKRGLALGTKVLLQGLSGVLVLPLIAFLINQQGWRVTCVFGGLVIWVIGLPLVWFLIKPKRPEYYGLLPDGVSTDKEDTDTDQQIEKGAKYAAEVEEVEFTLRQAMKTPTYWLLIAGHSAHGIAAGAISVHIIPFLTDMGINSIEAAGITAIMVFSSLPARFIGGFIVDRLRINQIRFVMVGGYLLQTLGFAIYLLNPKTMFTTYVWLILYGVGMGIAYVFSAMVGRYYGRKAYGSIQGSRTLFLTGPAMAAPIYAGWVYDTTGSYITSFITFGAALAVATVIMAFAVPPKPPSEISDISKIL